MGLDDPAAALHAFALAGEPVVIERFPGGHINASYRVVMRQGGTATTYLLQRVNPSVFPNPAHVMENVVRVTQHLAGRLRGAGVRDWRRRVLALVPGPDRVPWVTDAGGGHWRMYPFIEARVIQRATTPRDARGAARAFGRFLQLLADFEGPLHETIPGFHDTRGRYAALERAVAADRSGRAAGARAEIDALLAQRGLADVLPPLIDNAAVPRRVVHNDAKISNVLFDAATTEALGVVDLDTVMPGSALYDFGDLVRSTVSPAEEDETNPASVRVRPEFFQAVTVGFLETAGHVITPRERELLVFASRLITLEQAVRFLTDYLEGDAYYRAARPGHNLDRCRTQLRLFESLTARRQELEAIVEAASGS